ncbi:MAG: tetratricopeptide repeat protein [Candidatus Azobacteroides sp.]|nr:tetratricopeptide repeat protein [Candidatus Azobacteroides sp.]
MSKLLILFALLFSANMAYSQCENNLNNCDCYLNKGDNLFLQKKYDDAKKQYLAYKGCRPNANIDEKINMCDCENYLNKGDSLFSQKKYEEAQKKYLSYKICKPSATGIDKKIAACKKQLEPISEQKKPELVSSVSPSESSESVPLPSLSAAWWYNEGLKYKVGRNYSEAIQCYRKALDIDSSLLEVWNDLAHAYAYQGNYAEAINCYAKVAADNPSEIVWSNMGICYQHLKEYDQAIDCFQKSNDIVSNGSAWYGMGICYSNKEDLSTSKKLSKSKECLIKAAELGHEEAQKRLDKMKIKWQEK